MIRELPAPDDSPSSKKRASLRTSMIGLALLLVTSAASLVVVEVGYRLLRGIPLGGSLATEDDGSGRLLTFRKSTNDLLVYEPVPNARTRFQGVENAINSFGFREREIALSRPDGVYRIAVLGDSVVYGMGLEAEETFSRQLEHSLNASDGQTFQVLNFAVPGYSTQQEIEVYRAKVRPFQPDLVVLAYCLNDDREESGEIRLFDGAHFSIFEKFYFALELRALARPLLRDAFDVESYELEAQALVTENFARLRASLEPDTPLVIVLFPYFTDYRGYGFKKEHRRVMRLAKRNQFAAIDLLAIYDAHPAESLRLTPDDLIHPNRAATQIAADSVANFLRQESLVPAAAGD